MKLEEIINLKEKAKELREKVVRMTTKAGTGHVTSSFSCMELMVALYYADLLRYDSRNPKWQERDYFILSKGHANPIFYCILADLGFFPEEELEHFCSSEGKIGVLLRGDIPGTEITSGSLGCGLGIAAGIAEGLKLDRQNNKVVCLLGDAECREGAVWEAAMHIGYRKLNSIIVIVDSNNLGATHFVDEEAGVDSLDEKWKAFGFETRHINGHSFEEILSALKDYHDNSREKPLAIIADTIKGKGVSFIENQPFLHGVAIKPIDLERAIKEIQEGEIE